MNESSLVKIGMFGIDIGQLDANEILHHAVRLRQAAAQQLRDNIHDLLVQPRKSNEFLLKRINGS